MNLVSHNIIIYKAFCLVNAPNKVEEVVRSIQSEYITIDTAPLLGEIDGSSWTAPYSQFKSVNALLNAIWFALPQDRTFTYGENWLIKDANSGKVFDDIGRLSTTAYRYLLVGDDRPLAEVGIKPGTRLQVIPPK